MKSLVRPLKCLRSVAQSKARSRFGLLQFVILFVLALASVPLSAQGQFSGPKITKVEIRHRGPVTVSDDLIRANIRVKVGDPYLVPAVDDDVRNLYATGFFYNIQVAREENSNGFTLAYVLQ